MGLKFNLASDEKGTSLVIITEHAHTLTPANPAFNELVALLTTGDTDDPTLAARVGALLEGEPVTTGADEQPTGNEIIDTVPGTVIAETEGGVLSVDHETDGLAWYLDGEDIDEFVPESLASGLVNSEDEMLRTAHAELLAAAVNSADPHRAIGLIDDILAAEEGLAALVSVSEDGSLLLPTAVLVIPNGQAGVDNTIDPEHGPVLRVTETIAGATAHGLHTRPAVAVIEIGDLRSVDEHRVLATRVTYYDTDIESIDVIASDDANDVLLDVRDRPDDLVIRRTVTARETFGVTD